MTAAVPPNLEMQERLGQQLEAIVTRRIASDQLVLPPFPVVASKCLNLLRLPDFDLPEAALIIETDPILAARLLRLANSAAMGGRGTMTTIIAAVTRLGAQKLRAFLVEASAARLFESNDRRIVEASRGLWAHSVAVAAVSRDLMSIRGGGDPEMAYLGGLLHDIGKPIIASMLLDAERSLAQTSKHARWITGDDWIAVVQRTHRKVGLQLVEHWDLPTEVRAAVRDCGEYDGNDRLSVANVVRFANALVKRRGIYVGAIDKDENDAMIMIGQSLLDVDDQAIERATKVLSKRPT
jgi:putative nucleotidyltransferase with HDIG domain